MEVSSVMFWYGDGGWAFWQVALMWVGMIVFWAVLIWGVYAVLTRPTHRPDQPRDEADNARRILDKRLARGEIDVDEYRRLRDVMASASDDRPAGTRSFQ
jgi:putative membrane protein